MKKVPTLSRSWSVSLPLCNCSALRIAGKIELMLPPTEVAAVALRNVPSSKEQRLVARYNLICHQCTYSPPAEGCNVWPQDSVLQGANSATQHGNADDPIGPVVSCPSPQPCTRKCCKEGTAVETAHLQCQQRLL